MRYGREGLSMSPQSVDKAAAGLNPGDGVRDFSKERAARFSLGHVGRPVKADDRILRSSRTMLRLARSFESGCPRLENRAIGGAVRPFLPNWMILQQQSKKGQEFFCCQVSLVDDGLEGFSLEVAVVERDGDAMERGGVLEDVVAPGGVMNKKPCSLERSNYSSRLASRSRAIKSLLGYVP